MHFLRGIEEWGRQRAIGVLSRAIPTQEISAREAGEILGKVAVPRILLIGIYQHMGQFLCATPLIRSLRFAWPDASIDFLGNPVNAIAAEKNPRLDRVWVWRKTAFWEWPNQMRKLRKECFDLALLLTTERSSATGVALARATGARMVAAYYSSLPGSTAKDAATLCHVRIPFGGEVNEVEKYLGFARAFGVPAQGLRPELVPSTEDKAAAESILSELSIPGKGPLVGLFIGGKAQRSDRLWPVSHFAVLANMLRDEGFRVVVLSPPPPVRSSSDTYLSTEHLRLREFRRLLPWTCPVFQEAQLGRVAAFIRRLNLLVCPDGGIMHVAASVGTPTLGLFFSTDPQVWRHDLPQAVLDGRGKPSSQMRPESVLNEVVRFLGVTTDQ